MRSFDHPLLHSVRPPRAAHITAHITALALLATALPTSASVTLPLRLDLQQSSSTTATNFTALLPTDTYGSSGHTDYGYASNVTTSFSTTVPPEVIAPLPAGSSTDTDYVERVKLLADGHVPSASIPFKINLAAGSYRVHVVLGRPDQQTLGAQVSYTVGSTTKAVITEYHPDLATYSSMTPGAWLRTLSGKANFIGDPSMTTPHNYGGYRSFWFTIDVDSAGASTPVLLTFGNGTPVCALEFFAYQAPPAHFDTCSSCTKRLVSDVGPSGTSDENSFYAGVQALNALPMGSAATSFGAISDKLLKGTGYLWLAGWLGDADSLENDDHDAMHLGDNSLEWRYLPLAISELELAPVGALREELLDRARSYLRALKHQRLRAYTLPLQFPDGIGVGTTVNPYASGALAPGLLANLGCAEALWRDVSAQTMEAVTENGELDVNPLFFKALVHLGVNYWSRHSKNLWWNYDDGPTPIHNSSYYYVKQHFDLWEAFRENGYLDSSCAFSRHDALCVLSHMESWNGTSHTPTTSSPALYDEEVVGGIVTYWQGEGTSAVHGSGAANWWDGLLTAVDVVGSSSCTDWTLAQHQWRLALVAAHTWWLQHRLEQSAATSTPVSEFGGGSGDDPEFLLQQTYPILPFRGNDMVFESAAQLAVDSFLARYDAQAFYGDSSSAAADVEHTAEYTSNPLFVGMQLRWGNPYYYEYALRSLQHAADLDSSGLPLTTATTPSSTKWSDVISLSGSHAYDEDGAGAVTIKPRAFKAFYLDAEGPAYSTVINSTTVDTSGDTALNGRALVPAYYVSAYSKNLGAERLLRQWTEWWWRLCMDNGALAVSQPKPVGVIPALARWNATTSKVVYGDPNVPGSSWWQGGYGFTGSLGSLASCPYIYGSFLWRYLDPKSDASTRHEYLQPIFRAGQLAVGNLLSTYHPHQDCSASPASPMPFGTTGLTCESANVNTPGSNAWTGFQLRTNAEFLEQLYRALPYMKSDCAFKAWADSPSGAYADALDWFEKLIKDSGAVFAKMQLEFPAAAATTTLDTAFQSGSKWLDAFFPLASDMTAFADRVYISQGHAHQDLFATLTGGPLQNPPVFDATWEPRRVGSTLIPAGIDVRAVDASVLTLGWTEFDCGSSGAASFWHASFVNHEIDPFPTDGFIARNLELRLWHGIPPANYQVRWGKDTNANGVLDGGETYTSANYTHARAGTPLKLRVEYAGSDPCGMRYAVELHRVSSLSGSIALTNDIGISARDIDASWNSSSTEVHVVANVHMLGSTATSGVKGSIVVLYLDAGGVPVYSLPFATTNVSITTAAGPQGLVPVATVAATFDTSGMTVAPSAGVQVHVFLNAAGPGTGPGDEQPENDYAWRNFTWAELQ